MSALQILEYPATVPTSVKNITASHQKFLASLSI